MSCSCKQVVPLIKNQALSSAPDGSAKVYWSPAQDFGSAAMYFRALIVYANNAEVRVRGRYSLDGVTYADANPSTVAADSGYIDGLGGGAAAGWDAANFYSFQYLGAPDEHTALFQIGIEVRGALASNAAGTVTLSATASFSAAQPLTVDLGANMATLGATTVALLVPGARTVATAGYSRIRVGLHFTGVPAQPVTLYLATGPTATLLAVDQQTAVSLASANETTLSFVVEAPDAWSTVYYTVANGTTGTVRQLTLTLLP